MAQPDNPPDVAPPPGKTPSGLRIGAIVLRTLFLVIVALITLRVSLPQNETIWTAYDTPSDVVRMVLGLAVAAWLIFQLFKGPRDHDGYRTWFYLGLVAVPFSLVCLFAAW